MSAEYPRDPAPPPQREVIVTDGGDRGPGGIIAVLIGVAALVLIVWLLVSNLGGGDDAPEMDAPAIDVPEEIDVNVDNGGGGGGGDAGGDTGGGDAAGGASG